MMAIISEAVRHMLAAGMNGEALIAAIAAMEDAAKPVRSAGATRMARMRERHRASQVVTVTDSDAPHPPPIVSPTPPSLTPPITPPEKPNLTISKKASSAKPREVLRKTRMTLDFLPPVEWRDFAMDYGYTAEEAAGIATAFRDYWLAKGEPMADWFATWRNWIRRNEKYDAKQRAMR